MIRIVVLFSLFLLIQCQKIQYVDDAPIHSARSRIAHKAMYNRQSKENSVLGALKCLEKNDGVEVDVQISKDRTIWMSHNERVLTCTGEGDCFSDLTDKEILSLDSCANKMNYYNKLEDLIFQMSKLYPQKYLCIDLKGWVPCNGKQLDMDGMMRLEAEKIAELGEKYNFAKQMLLETNSLSALQWARKKSKNIGIYLVTYGDLERGMLFAMKYNLNGVSLKVNLEQEPTHDYMKLFHKKGKRLIAWNLSKAQDTAHYLAMGVDFVQYDME